MNLLEIRNQIAFAISAIEVGEAEKGTESLDKLVEYLDGRFSYSVMKNINYDTEEEDRKRFSDFLTKASAEVKTWPEWKRNILGRYTST